MKRTLLGSLFCWVALTAHADINLPDLGDPSVRYLSAPVAKSMGQMVIQQLRVQGYLIEEDVIEDYVREIGQRLLSTQADNPHDVSFYVIKDSRINAFALPGGFIGINTGLIAAVHEEDELASVMAHELAHVKQRHLARFFGHQQQVNLVTLAGMVAATLVATQSPDAGVGAFNAVLAGSQQSLINFTRFQEAEADQVGMRILATAGYDPMAMPRFFMVLHQATKLQGGSGYEFLRTHPLTENRVASAQSRASQFEVADPVKTNISLYFIQARLMVDTFSSLKQSRDWLQRQTATLPKDAEHYGIAYSYILGHDHQAALTQLAKISSIYQAQPDVALLRARAYEMQEQPKKALEALESGLSNYPTHRGLNHAQISLLIQEKQLDKAYQALRRLKQQYPDKPQVYWQLSLLYAEQDRMMDAYLAQADYRILKGDLQDALTQCYMAMQQADGDMVGQARATAKSNEIKDMIQAQQH